MRYTATQVQENKHYSSINTLIQPKKSAGIGYSPYGSLVQAKATGDNRETGPLQKQANQTGLPDNLKTGVENLSGLAMDDVRVHYNSDKPAQLQALAYTQGTDIHVAPGQEKHLPHEAWHVVQQKQGRVQPTFQMKVLGVGVNDDAGLERDADGMGGRALATDSRGELGQGTCPPVPPSSFSKVVGEEGLQLNEVSKINNTIQKVKNPLVTVNTVKDYEIVATDSPDKFVDGQKPGNHGIAGVDWYQAEYTATNQLNRRGNKTGKIKTEQSNVMNNNLPEYANGHLLPKEMGGPGAMANVFQQEGGQNSGSWRSFEIAASEVLANTPVDETFTYKMHLHGDNLHQY